MKQAEVLYQEIDKDHVKIVEFKNFERHNLPDAYFEMYPRMWKGCNFGVVVIIYNQFITRTVGNGEILTTDDFNLLIKTMKQCGENLKKSRIPPVKSIKI
jgi:hypothetical protein